MPLRVIYYDTETTGLKADRDRIIEIAAYDPALDRTFESFINPGCPIPAEATAIHRITDAMVAEAPDFSQVAADFIEFCSGDVVLVAHNNDTFDIHFLRHEFRRSNLQMPEWKFMDSLKWARRYRPDLPRHTLQFLREIYGIPANNAHRALDDVIVLYKVFHSMIDDLPIHEVYDLICGSRAQVQRSLEQMPFGKHQGVPLNKVPKSYVKWLAENGVFEKPENLDLKAAFQKIGFLEGSAAVGA
jgi:DNA polymerase-3 subunit epsilon